MEFEVVTSNAPHSGLGHQVSASDESSQGTRVGDSGVQDCHDRESWLNNGAAISSLPSPLPFFSESHSFPSFTFQVCFPAFLLCCLHFFAVTQSSFPPSYPQDQYDTINLSENEIRKLDNFPLLKRLKTLIIANNFISRIAPDLANNVPNITSIVLTNNNITSLSEIDALSCFKALKHLVLLENGVVKQANYRLYVINRIPSLKVLDFKRIKDKVAYPPLALACSLPFSRFSPLHIMSAAPDDKGAARCCKTLRRLR
jgi:Leucine-rich repeat (LRR) protein